MENKNIIINADDAGISKGVNSAIKQMILEGRLNSVSIMVNGFYVRDIVNFCIEHDVMCGLHFNLTIGGSTLKNKTLPNITNADGTFRYGFLLLSILSIVQKKIRHEVCLELEAQIKALQDLGVKSISHIDGHRHVHFIPPIFSAVTKIVNAYRIPRVRVINESIVQTALDTGIIKTFCNVGFIKWSILKTFYLLNKYILVNKKSFFSNVPYFVSIVHSCKIDQQIADKIKIPQKFNSIEIMIHPGDPSQDFNDDNIKYEKSHLTSHFRVLESKISLFHRFNFVSKKSNRPLRS